MLTAHPVLDVAGPPRIVTRPDPDLYLGHNWDTPAARDHGSAATPRVPRHLHDSPARDRRADRRHRAASAPECPVTALAPSWSGGGGEVTVDPSANSTPNTGSTAAMKTSVQGVGGVPRVTLTCDESLRLPPIGAIRIAGTDRGRAAPVPSAPRPCGTATARRPHPVDFSDPESERVLDAMADALLGPLVLQAARDDDEAEWLTSQQGRP
jgi:hypothetical protein